MNRYKYLVSNTMLFFISTFSSKFLVFLLMPIYTAALTTEEYNAVNLMMQTANIMIPIASFGMANGIIRFGLDDEYDKTKVFSIATQTYAFGFLVSLCLFPVINSIAVINQYTEFLYIYLFTSCLRTLVQQFARARSFTRIYALDGIVATVNTLLLVWLFLIQLKLGPIGYILAIIGADLLSAIFLMITTHSWEHFSIKAIDQNVSKEMLGYCIPFIPSSIFWWITNVSDHFLVSYMSSESMGGIYAASYKIPSIIMLCSTVFTEAWQISAVKESGKKHTNKFFGKVFRAYQSVIFISAAGLILICRPIMSIMVAPDYYIGWKFIPLLLVATVFSCFSTFLSSIYMVEKNGKGNLYTMMAGAMLNIVLNLALIPSFGANGAAFSTFLSYLLVFVLRVRGTKKFIDVRVSPIAMAMNLVMVLGLSAVMVYEIKYWIWISIAIVILIVIYNIVPILRFIAMILKGLIKKAK